MRAGCPHSQGGASPAFQHKSNAYAITSHQDNNVKHAPVGHPDNGMQINMVASQYPEGVRVVSAQRQQDNAQPRQHFQGLQHQQKSQGSIASTRFQHPNSTDIACTVLNSGPDFNSLPHAAAQCSSYFETSDNEYSVRQSGDNSGQHWECSKQNFSRHFLNGSNLNNNTILQQRQHLNSAFSAGTSSAALQGDALGVTAQTFPLQVYRSSLPNNKLQKSCPLLYSLLKDFGDSKFLYASPSSSSGQTNANVELNTSAHFSSEVPCKSQQVKSSLNALNFGQITTQNLLPVGKTGPPTDDQIQDFITEKLKHFITVSPREEGKDGHKSFHTNNSASILQSDHNTSKSNNVDHPHHPITSTSNKEERLSVSCGSAIQENSSKGSKANAELPAKSKDKGDCSTVASENFSTGTIVSPIRNLKHAPKNESVDNSASVDFNYPVKILLDVIMPTNDDGKRVYCEHKTFVGSSDESFQSKLCDKYLHNGMTTVHYSLTALKELVASLEEVETFTKMDNFSKVILKQYWNGDIDNVHLFTSTEYPQIMAKVAATCTKSEDKSPLVLTMSEMTLDGLTEKDPSLLLNSSLSKEEEKSLWLNINKDLHTTEKDKGDTDLKPMEAVGLDNVRGVTVSEDLQTKSSSVVTGFETLVLTSLNENQDAYTDKKKHSEAQHCHITCQKVIGHSKLNSSVDQIQIHNVISVPRGQSEQLWKQTSHGGVMEDPGSVRSQLPEPHLLPESKSEEADSVEILKDPQYEDISDDEDMSQLLTNLPNTEHEQLNFPPCLEERQYEDISEDDNQQIVSLAVETPSLTQVPETDNKQSPFENEDYGCFRGQAQIETENISDERLIAKKQISPKTGTLDVPQQCSCAYFGDTDYLLCPKCDGERCLRWETYHSFSYSPSSVLKDGDETDDEMDDDYIVIPISMSDIKFEPEEEAQDITEKVVLDDDETGDKDRHSDTNATHRELYCPVPKPVRASSSYKLEVFDTIKSFLRAKAVQYGTVLLALGRSTPEHELDSEQEQHTPQNRRESSSESEDSWETEDSCDYSSASEQNYMTVSEHLLKNRSAHLPPETNDTKSEKESENDEATNVQKGQTSSFSKLGCMQKPAELILAQADSQHVKPKTNIQISKKENIIILDSETEDESDQHCEMEAKGKRLVFKKNRLPSAASPAPQRQLKLNDEVVHDADSDLSHSTETSGQLIETKTDSEYVLHEKKSSQDVIILDSDTDNDSDKNYNKASRGRLFPSGLVDSDSVQLIQQMRPSPETVDSDCGTAEKKLQERRLSSADSSVLQYQSKLNGAQLKELMHNTSSDLSLSIKKGGNRMEAKGDSERGQQKSNRQTTSKRRKVLHDSDKVVKKDNQISKKEELREKTLSSVSKDSGDTLFAIQKRPLSESVNSVCGVANNKLQKTVFSSDDSPEKQLQSVHKEADSTLSPNPVIRRLLVKKSYQTCNYLKHSKEVHRQGKAETPKTKECQRSPKTPTAARKKMDPCEKNTKRSQRDEQEKIVPKPKPAIDRHCGTKNKVQSNMTKPGLVLRQLSLPCLEGPSTSTDSLTSTSAQIPEARRSSELSQSGETSTFSIPSKTMQSTSVPRHLSSSKLKCCHSYSNPSTSDHPSITTKGPLSSAPVQSSALEQVRKDWKKSYVAIRRDRKTSMGTEEALRNTNYESRRKLRPGPSHCEKLPTQRHNSLESAAPLLKRSKFEARELTKARNRDIIREQRYFMSEGSKWSEMPREARPVEGSVRERKWYRFPRRSFQ
ncbi:uncharacterized protein LOC111664243 isoform X1 [Seriola lalandi dorsalis]|uniref:uncharacterized protein LOC111664243 isoform X1 n=1 Tax=Seriola lalandi dorsalis TaxID=1841481 RepID=UPI000C6F8D43|nr:uncharacterized protein LOC111664243 isoform X1 [Seriola lalandi dorsalis]